VGCETGLLARPSLLSASDRFEQHLEITPSLGAKDFAALVSRIPAAMQHDETLEADINHKQSALDELHSRQQSIVTDQMRIRSNFASVLFNSQLHTRYPSMLESQEPQLGTVGDQTDAVERQLNQAKGALKAFLANLTI